MEQRAIAFIGAGNMARSIIAGLVASGYAPDKITATAPSSARREPLARDYGIHTTDNNLSAASDADVIVLAVKPQLMEDVCRPLQILDADADAAPPEDASATDPSSPAAAAADPAR